MDLHHSTVADLLEAIGSRSPTPGGGAVSAVVGALGCALGRMAARYSIRKSTPDEARASISQIVEELDALGTRFLDLSALDTEAYGRLSELQRLGTDDPERVSGWSAAVDAAIDAPAQMIQACAQSVAALERLQPLCNAGLASDLAIAAQLAASAARAAQWNVKVNLPLIDDPAMRPSVGAPIADAVAAVEQCAARIESRCSDPG